MQIGKKATALLLEKINNEQAESKDHSDRDQELRNVYFRFGRIVGNDLSFLLDPLRLSYRFHSRLLHFVMLFFC